MAEGTIKQTVVENRKTFRIYLCTWNVANKPPRDDLSALLGFNNGPLPDIYGIGLQEAGSDWIKHFTECLGAKGYFRIRVRSMGAIITMAFIKRTQLSSVSSFETEVTRTGFGGFMGNKGGVSVRFDLNRVNVIITNCHLAAHISQVADRIQDFNSIIDTQSFRDKNVDNILDHDYIFWVGDLNFRIDHLSINEVKRRLENKEYEALLESDQLNKAIEEELVFLDFNEGSITFPPTYKYDIGTDVFDSSEKQRIPAWCDRVLWMIHEDAFEYLNLSAKQLSYRSLSQYQCSDHKPVISVFDITTFGDPEPRSVEFQHVEDAKIGKNIQVTYTIKNGTDRSSWDWIGLFKSSFSHVDDYETYHWVAGSRFATIEFDSKYFKLPCSSYVFMYVSLYKNAILGISNEFQIRS